MVRNGSAGSAVSNVGTGWDFATRLRTRRSLVIVEHHRRDSAQSQSKAIVVVSDRMKSYEAFQRAWSAIHVVQVVSGLKQRSARVRRSIAYDAAGVLYCTVQQTNVDP